MHSGAGVKVVVSVGNVVLVEGFDVVAIAAIEAPVQDVQLGDARLTNVLGTTKVEPTDLEETAILRST